MTIRNRILAYLHDIATGPGSLILGGHLERAIKAPWAEIRSILDELAAENPPLLKREVRAHPSDESDDSFALSLLELMLAESTGQMFHPETGEEIHDWRSKIQTTYWTTKHLRTRADEEFQTTIEGRITEVGGEDHRVVFDITNGTRFYLTMSKDDVRKIGVHYGQMMEIEMTIRLKESL